MYYYVIYNMLISNPFTGKIYQSFNLFQVTSQAGFIPDKYHYQVHAKDNL